MKHNPRSIARSPVTAVLAFGVALTLLAQKTDPTNPREPHKPGNYYSAQRPEFPPLPFNPFPDLALIVVDERHFVFDDSKVDYAALQQQASAKEPAMMLSQALTQQPAAMSALTYESTNLWLEIQPGSNAVALILHNTSMGTNYQFFSRSNVAGGLWKLEADVPGNDGMTPTHIAMNGRANLFFVAGSGIDSDGDGLSDAYESFVMHTDPLSGDSGTNGIPDGFEDADGDGWTNQDEVRTGQDPFAANTPPLLGVFQTKDIENRNVVEWSPPSAAATSFTLERNTGGGWQAAGTISGSEISFTDTNLPPGISASYRIEANYPVGSSSFATPPASGAIEPAFTVPAAVTKGPGGSLYLVSSQLPEELAGLVFTRTPYRSTHPKDRIDQVRSGYPRTDFYGLTNPPSLLVPASLLAGGILPVSAAYLPPYGYYSMSLYGYGKDGRFGNAITDPLQPNEDATPFLDGRAHLLDNLRVALRAGGVGQQFAFYFPDVASGPGSSFPYGMSADYGFAGFHWKYYAPQFTTDPYEPFQPFEDSSVLRVFCFDANRFDSQGNPFDVGYGGAYPYKAIARSWEFYVSSLDIARSGSTNVPSRLVTPEASQYLFHRRAADGEDLSSIGLTWANNPPGWVLNAQARNIYGLPILSVRAVKQTSNPQPLTLYNALPGGFIPAMGTPGHPSNAWFYVETESPVLGTAGFYIAPGLWLRDGPGNTSWVPVDQTNDVVMALGQTLHLTAWARKAILNGYTNKSAYLQHYFDRAYKIAENGTITTNETGILSEYGDFFATEPGRVLLTTKPDLTDGVTGQVVVHVLKLQFDVNHDGTMDGRFAGADNTSAGRPFVCWWNNDIDRGHDVDCTPGIGGNCDFEEDDLPITDKSLSLTQRVPDYSYGNVNGPAIPSKRDLEDYARLWTTGITNLLPLLPTGAAIELTWRTTSSQNPTVDVFRAVEPDGGMGYLTNEATAQTQVTNAVFVGRVRPGWVLQLNANWPTLPPTEKYLFCGSGRGSGELVLRVRSGSTVLVEASAFIQIKDIKEMYERYNAGHDTPKVAPRPTWNWATDGLPADVARFEYPYVPALHTNLPYILFVHGWNMEPWEKDRYAETAFKRLYWQGYRGRFGSFRWPTRYGFDLMSWQNPLTTPQHFDDSEFAAWKSAAALRLLLEHLQERHPGQVRIMAHSMGNIVAGQALRTNVTLVHTYAAMQAALAAHTYDPAVTNRDLGLLESFTPNRYAAYWSNGLPCYFDGVVGAGRYINFFNADDYALVRWRWDQDMKPDSPYSFLVMPDGEERFYYNGFVETRRLYFPQDTFEIFSYLIEGRSFALGAQSAVRGSFAEPLQVNLAVAPLSFGEVHKEHSGQFRSTCMKRSVFWETVMRRMLLAP